VINKFYSLYLKKAILLNEFLSGKYVLYCHCYQLLKNTIYIHTHTHTHTYMKRFIAPIFMEVHVGLQNCSYNQFTTLSLRVFMRVNVRHIYVSAVKNNYNEKNTAATR